MDSECTNLAAVKAFTGEAAADVTDTTNVTAAGALMDSECTNLAAVKAFTGEAAADVTDATNVTAAGALMDSECADVAALKATTGTFLTADQTKLDGIETSADVTDATNVTAAGALMDSECAGLAALKATTGTFLSADESKLDGIEAAADVTDATNVASAGAGMLGVTGAWTLPQRAALLTDNDGSFDLDAKQNFFCTPGTAVALTFANPADGQSGYVKLVNAGAYAHTAHTNTKIHADDLTAIGAAGTFLLGYLSDGTDTWVTVSKALA